MKYVLVDLEWNQPLPEQPMVREPFPLDSEIIEIGAIRLNEQFEYEAEYRAYVKPVFYPVLNGKVVRLTKIRPQDLEAAGQFPEVCGEFLDWCGESFCLCTWGPDDVPALLDNMLLHGMETPELVYACNLQRIYSREIMRDDKQWALDKAVELLGLPMERAHDALNDVRNTLTICQRVDVLAYLEEYACSHVGYGKDRLAGLIAGRQYPNYDAVLADDELHALICPLCGETLVFGEWVRNTKNILFSYARCEEGDEFLGRFRQKRNRDGSLTVSRSVYDMSDALWDDYQDALDKQREQETGE